MIIKAMTLFLLLFFCAVGLMSVNFPDKDKLYNITTTSIHNSMINASKSVQINPNATGLGDIIINIVYKIVDTMFYVTEQVTKLAVKLAIENPQINFRLIINLILIALLLYIIVPLFKLAVVIYVLIKDIIESRKYRKEIRRLKELRR